MKRFGKYRGTVRSNADPEQLGRLQVVVPEVSPRQPGWALPCLPGAGAQSGVFVLPPVGASVWVEFEAGDPSRPIWTGGSWTSPGEVPSSARATPPGTAAITLQTATGRLTLSDAPGPAGGIVLASASGASILVNDTGITIQNGQGASIVLRGPEVSINGGALEVV